ncbi:MAG: InlB B-repeat-containing protein [Methanobrevibacter sp.]|nr:InlB B-repeat-containing protein [Methanobrevibacter sp.]
MKVKKVFVVLALAMLIFSMGLATAHAESEVKIEKEDSGLTIESKEKVASYKITWKANGGKIGSKNTKVTTVKKGSKIGKLVATPKRSGYTFKGWYTKKSSGTKITKNTKPTKNIIFYAQWKKKTNSNNLNVEEKKLVGTWSYSKTAKNNYDKNIYSFKSYKFNVDGTFAIITSYRELDNTPVTIYNEMYKGKWIASGGAIYLIDQDFFEGSDKDMKVWNFKWPNTNKNFNYQLSSDGKTINTDDGFMTGINTLYKK